ncbi:MULTISPECIES: flagellar basal body rod protein FlgC [Carnobacterium]|uniref:Flagellar basal-body rod protein FlgC n=2 Tax=Carnobacterium inhibens TaxID=147709 RepID=U5SAM8_9LACT|nr:flagellar basal body rod protein FlgC [Carnobacterium inhibens]AGY82349.1 flagellar basal body rod protein FlgC [Carnobacterium inhibens subsp. gilichinskyi]MBC9824492.1 flagellar basal body rod protein FlgC [Carnobacterium inhibens]MCM3511869.1 flagellar basal body rod protein FlgC [Carnobacterium inhibens]
MSIFDSMQINASGLSLERLKLDTISTNIANVNTTRTEDGEGPYLKKEVVFEESLKQVESSMAGQGTEKSFGVKPTEIRENTEDIVMEYDPTNPDANEEGYVQQSNVNMADEMIDMMTTLRTYDANVTAMNASKEMLSKALQITIG